MKKNFTLVVIVIIAILASMLLPAMSRARYYAHNTACIGQIKQMYLGVMSYTGDFEDCYPAIYRVHGAVDEKGRRYAPSLLDQCGQPSSCSDSPVGIRDLIKPYFGSLNELMKCPLRSPSWDDGSLALKYTDFDNSTGTAHLRTMSEVADVFQPKKHEVWDRSMKRCDRVHHAFPCYFLELYY